MEDEQCHEDKPPFVVAAEKFAYLKDADVILFNGRIVLDALEALRSQLGRSGTRQRKKCILFLTTEGGDPHAGYLIGRLLQRRFQSVTIVATSWCKSSGTLIASAANELVVSDEGELGPLDVQIPKPEEILDYTSSAVLLDGLHFLTKTARELLRDHVIDMSVGGSLPVAIVAPNAAQFVAALYNPILARIDPHRIGEVTRSNTIGLEYLHRLGRRSENLKDQGAEKLVEGYPDHRFVIDREEAEGIFHRVRAPDEAELSLIQALGQLVSDVTVWTRLENQGSALVIALAKAPEGGGEDSTEGQAQANLPDCDGNDPQSHGAEGTEQPTRGGNTPLQAEGHPTDRNIRAGSRSPAGPSQLDTTSDNAQQQVEDNGEVKQALEREA